MSFLWESVTFLLFSRTNLEVTPPTDINAKWLKRRGFTHRCPVWGKNRNFLKPQTPKPPKFAKFWSGQNFRSFSRLILGVSGVNTPYSSSEPNKNVIMNRQWLWGEKLIYAPKFCIGVQVTWYRICAMTICTGQALWSYDSRYTLGHNGGRIGNGVWGVEWSHDRWRHVNLKAQGRDPIMFEEYYRENGWRYRLGLGPSQWSTYRKWPMASRMVTWPMTSRDFGRWKS